jgi:pyrimidine-nucleoside phosphorylase
MKNKTESSLTLEFTPDVIRKKRDGEELSPAEIRGFVKGVSEGSIPDYQISAFLMATFFKGMTLDETVALTDAMSRSGKRFDLDGLKGTKVDKHSTGGIGDKVSIILAPLAAACGLTVPMMAGRGLGHTGGTIDKLESIPGYNTVLSEQAFQKVLSQVGCAIIGQSAEICPADRKLYAMRDVTSTVECIPLITASILSKKIAEGTQGLVLDLKVGNGAFMKTLPQARKLAKTMSQVAKKLGLKFRVVFTCMDQPLGYGAGNALEILECIEVLRNQVIPGKDRGKKNLVSTDLKELTLQLAAHMLELGGITKTVSEGRKLAIARLQDGSAWEKFKEMVSAQGGNLDEFLSTHGQLFKDTYEFKAEKRGYISSMDTQQIGLTLTQLGAGRLKLSDTVDPKIGFVFHKKLGSKVQPGEVILTAVGTSVQTRAQIDASMKESIQISSNRKSVPKLIFEVMK